MKTVDFEPDRSVGIAHIEGYARKARALMLVKDKAVAVGQSVLRKLGCRALVELNERFDIIEETIEPLGRDLIFGSQFGRHAGCSRGWKFTIDNR